MDHHNHIVALIAGAVALAVSCSPRIVELVRTEYITNEIHHRDTTFTRDSIYIREWMRGDTVWVDRFRDRYIFRDRWRDSVRIEERHDTTVLTVRVEKPLTAGQRAKIGAFWWLCGAVVICLGWIFRKPLFGILKTWLKL